MNDPRFSQPQHPAACPPQQSQARSLFAPLVATPQALYEAARNKAIVDCQMDRLFNPDFYSEQGQ